MVCQYHASIHGILLKSYRIIRNFRCYWRHIGHKPKFFNPADLRPGVFNSCVIFMSNNTFFFKKKSQTMLLFYPARTTREPGRQKFQLRAHAARSGVTNKRHHKTAGHHRLADLGVYIHFLGTLLNTVSSYAIDYSW